MEVGKTMWIIIFIILACVIFYLIGPRINVDTDLTPVDLPHDLEAYLQASEAQFPDIQPGTEKIIFWADPATKQKTPVSLVYLHGFSASRQETVPVTDRVADELGANLFYTRLTGHGLSGEALAEATTNDWLNDSLEAIDIGRKIGEKVVVVSTSTSGTLITWLAAEGQVDDVIALVLLSPNFGPNQLGINLSLGPWGRQIVRLINGPTRSWEPHNAEQAIYWTHDYPVEPVLQMMGAVKIVREADLSQIKTPMLLFYSPQDTVVDPNHTLNFFEQVQATPKQLVLVPDIGDPHKHIVTGDILSPKTNDFVVEEIIAFLKPLLDGQ